MLAQVPECPVHGTPVVIESSPARASVQARGPAGLRAGRNRYLPRIAQEREK